jgi:hypothetical protein
VRLLAVAVGALLLAPVGKAWTRLTSDSLPNTVEPSVFRTTSGSELVGWRDQANGVVMLLRLPGGTAQPLVADWPGVGTPRFVQLPDGTLVLLFAGRSPDSRLRGVLRMSSRDDGRTWSAPLQTGSSNVADVESAAVRPDGTPLFVQTGSFYVNVFQGLAAKTVHNLFRPCCGYAATLGVDSNGLAQIAFWSIASSAKGFLYGALSPAGSLAGSLLALSGPDTIIQDDRVPLAVDQLGNTFVSWSVRSPDSNGMNVSTFRNGVLVRTVPVATGGFTGVDPHMALAVDPSNRLWAVWTRAGTLWAARSRTAGASFGAPVHARLAGGRIAYQLSAVADGSRLAVFLNLGGSPEDALWSERLLPGLTVIASKGFLRVRDDGFPVEGALVRSGSRSLRTDGKGRVLLSVFKHRSVVRIRKQGYSPATFRIP